MDNDYDRHPEFQPTLPARGATGHNFNRRESRCDFNPRSPHGERRHARRQRPKKRSISTHAPRTGSDILGGGKMMEQTEFQPTLPARGATTLEND